MPQQDGYMRINVEPDRSSMRNKYYRKQPALPHRQTFSGMKGISPERQKRIKRMHEKRPPVARVPRKKWW